MHIRHYLKARAKCYGIDFSRTMIEIARRNCPDAEFKIGNMKKLPYKDSSFDIVTCSLAIDYLDRLLPAFREAYRVLKMGGLFYFSTASSINIAKQRYEDRDYKIVGIGEFKDKRKNKQIVLGHAWYEGLVEWEMVPGMIMKTYNRTFRTHLLEMRKAGFELADLIDCKPSKEFKKYDPEEYAALNKFPAFSIYVGIKK